MPWSAEFATLPARIEVRYVGIVTPDDLRAAFNRTLELGQKHGVMALLADCTQLVGGHTVEDLYGLINALFSSDLLSLMQEAVLPPTLPQAAADVAFWVRACRNRGMNVSLFATREKALAWLSESESEQ